MSKLIVMKYNQIMMAIFGMNTYSFASFALNWLRASYPFVITTTLITCIRLALIYAFNETLLARRLEGLIPAIAAITSLSSYLCMMWKVNGVDQIKRNLQRIVDQGIYQYSSSSRLENKEGSRRQTNHN